MPGQRHVMDVAAEHDDAGLLVYDTVIWIVPRQSGKTTGLWSKKTWSSRRGRDRTSVYAAQDRQMARKKMLDEFEARQLARNPLLAGRYKARRSNGSEEIRWRDRAAEGSVITIVANTDDAGHGLTCDDVDVDEAFAHKDLTIITALDPTMITRPDPQLWIVSTIGDGTDGLVQHYQDVGLASLSDPATKVAYFEWSAGPDDDRTDPVVWRRVMPALGYTQSEDRVRRRLTTLPAAEFDRSYLCRRPNEASNAKLPAEAWAACGVEHVELVGPVVLAAAVALDRSKSTIAAAGIDKSTGRRAVLVDTRPGTGWCGRQLAGLVKERFVGAVVADRRGGAGTIIDDAIARGVVVDELDAGDVVTHCGTLYDAVVSAEPAGRLAHQRQDPLTTAAARAVDRPLGEAWAWSARLSDADIHPLVAATEAVGKHAEMFPLGVELGGIV